MQQESPLSKPTISQSSQKYTLPYLNLIYIKKGVHDELPLAVWTGM